LFFPISGRCRFSPFASFLAFLRVSDLLGANEYGCWRRGEDADDECYTHMLRELVMIVAQARGKGTEVPSRCGTACEQAMEDSGD
jgi:hypothetical protein